MKPTFKVIMPVLGVAALLALPTTAKAQGTVTAFRNVPSAGTIPPSNDLGHQLSLLTACHTPQVLVEFDNFESGYAQLLL